MKKRELKTLKLEKKIIANFDNSIKGGMTTLVPVPVVSLQTNCVENRVCQNISLDLPMHQCR